MKQDFVTVLDIGSSKITCMAASGVSGGEFVIRAVGQSDYNGFDENGWYEPDTVAECIRSAVSQVEAKTKCRIKDIIVGVPANFCYVSISEANSVFRTKKRIDAEDVAELYSKANIFEDNASRKVIGSSPLYFMIDGAIKMFDPIGAIAQRITGVLSFSFMSRVFEKTVGEALARLNIRHIKYVNTAELQAKYIGMTNSVNGYSIVIDVGYITSYVMLTGGRGLMFLKSFALGSGYIASDLHEVLNLSYNNSLYLLDKLRLNLEFRPEDVYTISNGTTAEAAKANEVVKARIEQIANYIIRCFEACDREIPATTPVVLTGGGLTYLRGAADCLSEYLGKEVQVFTSTNPQTNRNEYTSTYGLLQYGVMHESDDKGGMLSKLIRRIRLSA